MSDLPCNVLKSSFWGSTRCHAPSKVFVSLFTLHYWPPCAAPVSHFQKNTARIQIGGCQSTSMWKVHTTKRLHTPSHATTTLCGNSYHLTRHHLPPCATPISRFQNKSQICDWRLPIYQTNWSTRIEEPPRATPFVSCIFLAHLFKLHSATLDYFCFWAHSPIMHIATPYLSLLTKPIFLIIYSATLDCNPYIQVRIPYNTLGHAKFHSLQAHKTYHTLNHTRLYPHTKNKKWL